MYPHPKRTRVLSFPVLALVVLGGIGVSLFLVPTQDKLRVLRERDVLCDQIAPILEQCWSDPKRKPRDILAMLPSERLDFLATLARLQCREQLIHIFDPSKPLAYDTFVHHFALAAVEFINVVHPSEAWSIIKPVSAQIPDESRLALLRLISKNAMATGDSALAATIALHYADSVSATWKDITSMILAARWSGQTKEAIAKLRAWQQHHAETLTDAEKTELLQVGYNLALEANLPGDALDICIAEIKSRPAITADSAQLIAQAHQAAILADRSREVLPWIESYLATTPEARLTWQDLNTKAHANNESLASYKEWLQRAAQIADWHTMTDKSFAHISRLVAMGDISYIDRFIPLAHSAGRGQEMAEILNSLGPLAGKESIAILIARLMASNGINEKALGMYEGWIKANPQDRAARFEHACLIEGTQETHAAIAAFESFLRSFPMDVPVTKKLAALRIRAGQYEMALSDLSTLKDSDLDHATLESLTMLAESLDRDDLLLRALKVAAADPKQATPETYIRMAEIARRGHDDEAPLRILREGVARMSTRPALRIELVTTLIEQERFDEALTEALHPALSGRFDAQCLALSAAIHTERTAEALKIAGRDFEKQNSLSLSARLDLAVACLRDGQKARGESLLTAVPEKRDTYARLGEARMLAGQLQEAERLARLNLLHNAAPKAPDYILLGDVHSRQGHDIEANDAYAKALAIATNRLANEAAANQPPVASSQNTKP